MAMPPDAEAGMSGITNGDAKRTSLVGKLNKTFSARHNLKHINVHSSVLETYHDSFLFGNVPLSVRLRVFLRGGALGYIWFLVEFNLAVLSGVLYIYSTYGTTNPWVSHVQNAISAAFLVDYILRIYSEPARLYYLFSLTGIVDVLSVIPIFNVFRTRKANGDIYHLLQFLRIVRISSCMSKMGIVGSSLTQQIVLLMFSTAGAVVLDAGIIQWLEYQGSPEKIKRTCPRQGCMSFWDAFYFIIVTMSTVGYGDVVPKTIPGQAAIIVTILIAVAVLPAQVSRISTLAHNRPYGGSFNARKVLGSRFLIISGSIELRIVQSFLAELYNPTHAEDLEIYPMHVIILAPFTPSFELQQLLALYNNQVEFYEGSPSQTSDLCRISASKASAFFLLADQEALDTRTEDQAQIFRALAVSRYCKGRVRIIVEVLEPETQRSAVWDNTHGAGIEIICQAKLHNKLLARSCTIKGLYTFITNLFTSEIRLHHIPSMLYIAEYNHSFDNEVYPVIFPSAFYDLLFEEVVEFVYSLFNVVLFALDIPWSGTSRRVLLHPKGHIIQPDDIGIVMAVNLNTVYDISKFETKCTEGYFCKRKEVYCEHKLLEAVSSKWKGIGTVASFKKEKVPGIDLCMDGSEVVDVPSSPVALHKLKADLRSAVEKSEADTGKGHPSCSEKVPEVSTLETTLNDILGWPLLAKYGRPQSPVLERNKSKILQHLERSSLHVVSLKKSHILVCSQGHWSLNLFYFLLELRKPNFPNFPVVILHPVQPDAHQWGSVGAFKDVFFIKGSPLYEVDLLRAGLLQAEKVIVLAYPGAPLDASGKGVEQTSTGKKPGAYTSDVDSMVILANIERLLHGDLSRVLIEMQHVIGLHYLWPHIDIPVTCVPRKSYKRNVDGLMHFTPAYMEGRAFSSSMLNFLMRSSFYNKNTISIVEQLVEGGSSVEKSEQGRVLEQIQAPEKYVNRAYGEMFVELLEEQGVLALGLYRAKGTHKSPCPYVCTNPPKDSVVNAGDLVYVLI